MCDQQHCHVHVALQILEQFENLRLDRHVERGGGFIGNQQLRFIGERHRNHHALPLSARQFVRVGVESTLRFAKTNQLQQFESSLKSLDLRHALMYSQSLADLL